MQEFWASSFWNWELSYLRWTVENAQFPVINEIFKIFTLLGEMALIFFIAAFIMVAFKKTRKTGIVILVGLVFVAGLNHFILKPIFNRPRPFDFEGDSADALALKDYITAFAEEGRWLNGFLKPGSKSFMSGHTLSAFIFGVTVAIYHKKWAIPALLASALMAYTRLYFGFHYPTDIIFGLLVAIGTSFALTAIANKHGDKIAAYFINLFNKVFKRKKVAESTSEEEANKTNENNAN